MAIIDRVLARPGQSHARVLAGLFVLALTIFLPGFAALPPMDRDEPRFAQASKQMIETGDAVDIRFQDEARWKKPVGIYWLQAAAVQAGARVGVADAGRQIWLYRAPSLAGALAAVLLTYWAALPFLSRRGAATAAALLAACVLAGVEARLAKTDAVLLATVVAAMGAMARAWFAHTNPRTVGSSGTLDALVFWVALGVGVLVKGPITPMIAAFVAIWLTVRERDGRWLLALRPGLGVAVLVLIVSPWLVAIYAKTGSAFFREALGNDMLGKVAGAQERHGAPPGTYLAVFWATFWPVAPFVALALPFAWRERRDDALAFLIAWVVPAWALFELVPTKLPHYVLPLYPALAIGVSLAIERGALHVDGWWRKAVSLLLPLIPLALLVAAPVVFWRFDHTVPRVLIGLLVLATATSAFSLRLLWQGGARASLWPALLASLLVSVGAYQFAMPRLSAFTISTRLAEAGRAACAAPRFASVGYREPSLIFLTDTSLRLLEAERAAEPLGERAAEFLAGDGCRVLFATSPFESAFSAALAAKGVAADHAQRVSGLNVNSGRALDIDVWTKR